MSADQSELLTRLSSALTRAATDLTEVVDVAVRGASAVLGDVAVVQIVDEKGLLSTSGPQSRGPRLVPVGSPRADEGLSGRLAVTGRPIVNNAVGSEQIAAGLPGLQTFIGESATRALLLLPLIADGDYLGLIAISRGVDDPFADADVVLGTDLAARIALAVAAAQSVSRLRASESRYRRILETSLDGMWEGDHTAVTTFVNDRAAEMLGYPREAMLGQPLARFLGGQSAAGPPGSVTGCLTRVAQQREVELVRADGTRLWAEVNAVALPDDAASPARFFGTFRDISDRVRARDLETRLDRGGRLDGLGQFAGVAAHNFNNLLTVITGSAQMLLTMLPAGEPARALVAEIAGAAAKGSGICAELLTFGRSRSGPAHPLDLRELLADLEGLLRLTAGDHIDVVLPRCTGAGASDAWVTADRGHLEQALINLAVNAREAMGEGGTLTVDCDHTVGIRREPGDMDSRDVHDSVPTPADDDRWYVRLSVSDSGCGMDTDTLRRAFEPLFTTKEPNRGTGLGLASVCCTVHRAGGVVNLRSKPGAGTVVEVYLPATDAQPRPESVTPVTRSTAIRPGVDGDARVLVVEDEPAVARVVSRLLAEAGYTVDVPGTADAALSVIRDGCPTDLLITDVMMPGLTGPELSRQVHDVRPGLPVLFVSGYLDDDVGPLGPGTALLEKPFTREALRDAVASLLGRSAGAANPPGEETS
ncbi:MAG: PAS domain S-box protein [Actinoplanes sp.]